MAGSSQTAQDKVLGLPELKLNVFSFLPTQDLVQATRTCKDWNEIIHDDMGLQQTLFQKRAPTRYWIEYSEHIKNEHYPDNKVDKHKPVLHRNAALAGLANTYPVVELHPILPRAEGARSTAMTKPMLCSELIDKAPERTLLTQPPIAEVEVRLFATPDGTTRKLLKVRDLSGRGLTIGALADVLSREMARINRTTPHHIAHRSFLKHRQGHKHRFVDEERYPTGPRRPRSGLLLHQHEREAGHWSLPKFEYFTVRTPEHTSIHGEWFQQAEKAMELQRAELREQEDGHERVHRENLKLVLQLKREMRKGLAGSWRISGNWVDGGR